MLFCGYETPRQFWSTNRVNAWIKIMCQPAETIMVYQWQRLKRMCHQGNNISLKLTLIWMIISIRMACKEVIWQSAPNTYLVSLSPLSTSNICVYLRCVVWLWGLPELKERQENGELFRMSMKDMVPYSGGVFFVYFVTPFIVSCCVLGSTQCHNMQ